MCYILKRFMIETEGGSMKHSFLAFVIALFVAIPANATLTESEGCYQISTADDLYELAELYRSTSLDDELAALLKCAELTQDIVVNENVLKEDAQTQPPIFSFICGVREKTTKKQSILHYPTKPLQYLALD